MTGTRLKVVAYDSIVLERYPWKDGSIPPRFIKCPRCQRLITRRQLSGHLETWHNQNTGNGGDWFSSEPLQVSGPGTPWIPKTPLIKKGGEAHVTEDT